jgi:hypothetical protein
MPVRNVVGDPVAGYDGVGCTGQRHAEAALGRQSPLTRVPGAVAVVVLDGVGGDAHGVGHAWEPRVQGEQPAAVFRKAVAVDAGAAGIGEQDALTVVSI